MSIEAHKKAIHAGLIMYETRNLLFLKQEGFEPQYQWLMIQQAKAPKQAIKALIGKEMYNAWAQLSEILHKVMMCFAADILNKKQLEALFNQAMRVKIIFDRNAKIN